MLNLVISCFILRNMNFLFIIHWISWFNILPELPIFSLVNVLSELPIKIWNFIGASNWNSFGWCFIRASNKNLKFYQSFKLVFLWLMFYRSFQLNLEFIGASNWYSSGWRFIGASTCVCSTHFPTQYAESLISSMDLSNDLLRVTADLFYISNGHTLHKTLSKALRDSNIFFYLRPDLGNIFLYYWCIQGYYFMIRWRCITNITDFLL